MIVFDNVEVHFNFLCDSDYIHNHKKLLNRLDHNARTLRMEKHLIHISHLRHVYDSMLLDQHGLTRSDIDRDDRQNWRSAQRLSFQRLFAGGTRSRSCVSSQNQNVSENCMVLHGNLLQSRS